jgi:transcriptional regulator with XRE-family HTH domain
MGRKLIDITATVALDGAALKRIREEQKLTQLYVSKVVGVTPDTISRWENNRYPSMRRDNALKLAEALEVDLERLLFRPEPPELSAPPPKSTLPWLLTGALLTLLLIAVVSLLLRDDKAALEPASVTAERILPTHAAPGAVIPVQLRLTHRAGNTGFILREYLPKGWKLIQSNPPASSIDNDSGIARWIVKSGDAREQVVYLVQVDRLSRAASDAVFQGEVVAGAGEGKAVAIQGVGQTAVAPVHWADQNGDEVIDDGEMLQASYTVDEMAGVHIDWFELERLWSAGGYRWHEGQEKFIPVRPLGSAAGTLKR